MCSKKNFFCISFQFEKYKWMEMKTRRTQQNSLRKNFFKKEFIVAKLLSLKVLSKFADELYVCRIEKGLADTLASTWRKYTAIVINYTKRSAKFCLKKKSKIM